MNFRRTTFKLVLALTATGIMVALATFSGAHQDQALPANEFVEVASGTPSAATGRDLLNQFSAAFKDAAAHVSPSVVPIFSEQTAEAMPFTSSDENLRRFFDDGFFRRFFGGDPRGAPREVRSFGSGVIVSQDGYILTNNHVVENADEVTVVLQDEKKYAAEIIGTDPETDLAVIKIDADGLPAAKLGDSDVVNVGQWVIAVGNPFQLMHTVTTGIISATGRSAVGLANYENFIQTDASINPGNSGGALADLDGNVIGINTAISSPSGGNVGIGFAIPINMARGVMMQLIDNGVVSRGFLGLVPQDVDEGLAKGLDLDTATGALVGDVTPEGPAGEAGIRRGDVITSFDGVPVEDSAELRNVVADTRPGSKVNVGIVRDGKKIETIVKLGERPSEVASAGHTPRQDATGEAREKLGLSVRPLTPELASRLGYENEKGVVVEEIAPGGPAADTPLRPGDLVKEFNRVPVESPDDLARALEGLEDGDTAALLIQRGRSTFYTSIELVA